MLFKFYKNIYLNHLLFLFYSSGFKPKAPAGTPISVDTKSRTVKKPVKVVEVQEVFDVDDLNSTWDNAFVPKQCLVWVPNPNYKRKVTQDQM